MTGNIKDESDESPQKQKYLFNLFFTFTSNKNVFM